MIDMLLGIGMVGLFISIVLLVTSLIKRTGLFKRYLILTGSFFLLVMLGVSLEDGLNGIFTFIGIVGFLAVIILIGLIIYSTIKKTGKTKKYAKMFFIPFLIMIIGFANSDISTEASLDHDEHNNHVEQQKDDKDEKESKEDPTKEKNEIKDKEKEQQDKEKDDLKNKEKTEKVDRDKKDEEAKEVTKKRDENRQTDRLGELKVHYIDVGQADATLLEVLEDGKKTTMLIDTGDWNRTDALEYLKAANVTNIDVVVGTHPHADHIGQLDKIINAFQVDEVWMSGDIASSKVFQRAIQAIDTSGANYVEPRAGENYQIGNLRVEIVSPRTIGGGLNDGSIAMRISYGGVVFLFTGDAETKAEQGMVSRGHHLKADILHLGHHGASTSTTSAFFDKVNPKVAIYSAGQSNSYGHPSPSVVNRVKNANVDLYGTDVHGTIVITTDGKTYNISTNQKGTVTATKETKPKPDPKPKPESKPNPKPEESQPKESETTNGCVDINTASKEQLETIIHIGSERSELLLEGRPYSSVEDLTRIKGIAAGRLKDIIEQGVACVK